MENIDDKSEDSLTAKIKDYILTRIELVKLTLIEKVTVLVPNIIISVVLLFLFLFVLLFASLGLSFYLSALIGNTFIGFFLVAILYLIILFIILLLKKSYLQPTMSNMAIKSIFKNKEEKS